MQSLNKIPSIATNLWRNLPNGSTPTFLTALNLGISNHFTSDYRIRAGIVLTGGLCFLVQRVRPFFQNEFEGIEEPHELSPPPLLKLEKDQSSYLNMLPDKILQKTGNYLDEAAARVFRTQPITDYSLEQIRQGLDSNIDDSEEIARQALAAEGIYVFPYWGETALSKLRRHSAVIAPDSRLLQGTLHILKEKKLTLKNKNFKALIGPLIFQEDRGRTIAYHWPTGTVKWIQFDGKLPIAQLDLRTGHQISSHPCYVNDSLEHLEIREPRKLINHKLQQEIILSHDCQEIVEYRHPYLLFVNNGTLWIKNGDALEFDTQIPFQSQGFNFKIGLFQPPYMLIFCGGTRKSRLYSMIDKRFIHHYTFSLEDIYNASIRQRTTPEPDIFHYIQPGEAVQVSFQKSSVQKSTIFKATKQPCPRDTKKQGSLLCNMDATLSRLRVYHPGRGTTFHQLPDQALLVAIHNQFLLMMKVSPSENTYYVIDLAEQSLIAQPPL